MRRDREFCFVDFGSRRIFRRRPRPEVGYVHDSLGRRCLRGSRAWWPTLRLSGNRVWHCHCSRSPRWAGALKMVEAVRDHWLITLAVVLVVGITAWLLATRR